MNNQADDLNFDTDVLVEIPFNIGKDAYVLLEADGDVACKYRNKLISGATFDSDGHPTGAHNIADAEPYLIANCSYKVLVDEKTGARTGLLAMPEAAVRKWPSRILNRLFKKVKKISDLDESDVLPQKVKCPGCSKEFVVNKDTLVKVDPTQEPSSEQK